MKSFAVVLIIAFVAALFFTSCANSIGYNRPYTPHSANEISGS